MKRKGGGFRENLVLLFEFSNGILLKVVLLLFRWNVLSISNSNREKSDVNNPKGSIDRFVCGGEGGGGRRIEKFRLEKTLQSC